MILYDIPMGETEIESNFPSTYDPFPLIFFIERDAAMRVTFYCRAGKGGALAQEGADLVPGR